MSLIAILGCIFGIIAAIVVYPYYRKYLGKPVRIAICIALILIGFFGLALINN